MANNSARQNSNGQRSTSGRAAGRGDRRNNDQGNSTGGRGSSSSRPFYAARPTGLVPELPLLQYGATTNFIQFRKALVPYCENKFKELATFFHTNEYFMVGNIEFDPLELTEDNDPFGFKKELIKQKYRDREKLQQELQSNSYALFGLIWGQLSESSIQVVTQHTDFDAIRELRDAPLELWRIIVATHVTVGTGQEIFDQAQARKDYAQLRQGNSETLVRFKERFDNCVMALTLRDQHVPSNQIQAIDFIEKLDSVRYSSFQVNIKNTTDQNQLPATLAEAYRRACTFVVAIPKYKQGNEGIQSVFVTTTNSLNTNKKQNSSTSNNGYNNKQNNNNHNGGRGHNKKGRNDNHPAENSNKKNKVVICVTAQIIG
jgi:hypothetical protein